MPRTDAGVRSLCTSRPLGADQRYPAGERGSSVETLMSGYHGI